MAPKAEAKAAALDLARSHQEGPRGRPSPRPDLRVSCEPPIPAEFRPTRPGMINGHLPYTTLYVLGIWLELWPNAARPGPDPREAPLGIETQGPRERTLPDPCSQGALPGNGFLGLQRYPDFSEWISL